MAWTSWIQYEFPLQQLFHKEILWTNKNCNCYFAFKMQINDDWTWYAGNASHALATGRLLTEYSTEAQAQTNYLTTDRDSNGKTVTLLPSVVQAKYARVYIETGNFVQLYEWRPSTYLTADEIVSGELQITDELSDAPMIRVTKSDVDRIRIGNFEGTDYGIVGYDSTATKIFELSDARQNLAGWDFTATNLKSNNVSISNRGRIKVGSGNDAAWLDSQDSIYRFWIGNADPALAPFRVTKTGRVYADSAEINGTLAASSITTRELATRTITHNNIVINTVTATELAASCITANKIRGANFGTLTLESGKIVVNAPEGLEVNTASGLVVQDGGGVLIRSGGNIEFIASSLNTPEISFYYPTGYNSKIKMGRLAISPQIEGSGICFWNEYGDSFGGGKFQVGWPASLAGWGGVARFNDIDLYAQSRVVLHTSYRKPTSLSTTKYSSLRQTTATDICRTRIYAGQLNSHISQINISASQDTSFIKFYTENTLRAELEEDGNFIFYNSLELSSGATINEFSTDGTLGGDSDEAVPTEKAVKTYVDATGFVSRGDPSSVDFDQTSLTMDNTFHDLDLTSIVPVGAKAILIFMSIASSTAGRSMNVIPYGNSNSINTAFVREFVANYTYRNQGIVSMDSNRTVQYKISGSVDTAEITVIGWWL